MMHEPGIPPEPSCCLSPSRTGPAEVHELVIAENLAGIRLFTTPKNANICHIL